VTRPTFHEPEGRAPIPGASSLWWGEATDEPAREDARPTNRFMAPMRVQSWRLWLSMNRTPSPHPSSALAERVPEGRVRGFCVVRGPNAQSQNRGGFPESGALDLR